MKPNVWATAQVFSSRLPLFVLIQGFYGLAFIVMSLDQTFLRGIGWLGTSQLTVRVARLGATVVVARWLAPEHFGMAAVVLTVNELSHVIAKTGTASRIINAGDEELPAICQTASAINWILGICLFLVQCLLAAPIAHAFDAPALVWPICALAVTYLLLPLAQVQCALNVRAQRMKVVARSEMAQAIGDSALTILMAIAGLGLWALVLPKVVVVPAWVYVHRRAQSWRASRRFDLSSARSVVGFTRKVLAVEVLGVFRHNIDYILIGYFLGLPALGIYFFAYNAGLGISRGFMTVLNQALFPHLCNARTDMDTLRKRFMSGSRLNLVVVSAVVVVQALLAPYYIPVIFGERWVDLGAVPLVVLICLSGIPLSISDVFSQLLRAVDRAEVDLAWHLRYSLMFVLVVVVALQWGLPGVAFGITLFHFVALPFHHALNIKPILKGVDLAVTHAGP